MGRMRAARRYLLVSPCRDEAGYMRRTLDSVAAKTRPPALWVDRGRRFHGRHPRRSWRSTPGDAAVHPRRPARATAASARVGPGVIEAFYAGLDTIDLDEFDYVCKLDLDLDLPPHYFENLDGTAWKPTRASGRASGKPYFGRSADGTLDQRGVRRRDVRGHDQVLPRSSASSEIGGFVRAGHVGRDRLPPLPHARLDRRERGRARTPLHPSARSGTSTWDMAG